MPGRLAPLSARAHTIEEILRFGTDGRIRIPRFQRGLRWEFTDVRKLFESILWGYPIGGLLMWERPAPKEELRIGAVSVDAPALQSALWVVDGQQRLTSLINALLEEGYRDPRFGIDYDLKEHSFKRGHPDRPVSSVPLPVLFDLRRLLQWYTDHPEMADYITEANDVATRLRQYPVTMSVVSGADEAVLREIFDRMNNFGKRLTRAEIFSALNPSNTRDPDEELTVGRIAERIDAATSFGMLDDDTILRIILSRRGADVTREIREEFDLLQSEFPKETRDEAFERAEIATRRAITFLQDTAGVPHFSFLPYRYLLVVLARFFAHFPDPKARNTVLLRRWFWRAAVLGPEIFKGSATGAMRALNNRIQPGRESSSLQALLNSTDRPPINWPNVGRFRTNEAATRLILAALWDQHPRSFASGDSFDRQAISLALGTEISAYGIAKEIFPRRLLPIEGKSAAGNRLLFPMDEGVDFREVLTEKPLSASLKGLWPQIMSSHLVTPEALAALTRQDVSQFISLRGTAIEGATLSFLRRMAEYDYDATPPLEDLDFDTYEPDDEDGRDG